MVTRCKRCHAPIEFRVTPSGRYQPIDPGTGVVHFATCSARPPAKTAGLPEDVCLACGSLRTERTPGTAQHHAGLRCLDCRAFRWLPTPRAESAGPAGAPRSAREVRPTPPWWGTEDR